jgi:hypothetical protein
MRQLAEYFDVTNLVHINNFKLMCETGQYSRSFIDSLPEDVNSKTLYLNTRDITDKMVAQYLKEKHELSRFLLNPDVETSETTTYEVQVYHPNLAGSSTHTYTISSQDDETAIRYVKKLHEKNPLDDIKLYKFVETKKTVKSSVYSTIKDLI